MCGITGISEANPTLIKKMNALLAHRGPDDSGIYSDRFVTLGHQRLSILDLSSKGHQPMVSRTKKTVIVFNGEIYNYPTLKAELLKKGYHFQSTSDTEVILAGYEAYGLAIVHKLEGMFAFALWDIRAKKLVLARDPIGEKPLYYNIQGERILFASELKSLLCDKRVPRTLHYQALSDFLSLRFSPGTNTLFQDIHKLAPGHYLLWENGKTALHRYALVKPLPVHEGKPTEVDTLLTQAIEERLMADVPVGVFLSGGLDSSTLVAYMSRSIKNLKTFAVGFGDPTDELVYARRIAEHFKTDHTELLLSSDILARLPEVVWHADEPLADPAALPTYVLAEAVSKHIKVVISGEGGDEVFGGYQTTNLLSKLRALYRIPHSLRKPLLAPLARASSTLFSYPRKQILQLGAEILTQKEIPEMYRLLFYQPFSTEEKKTLLGTHARGIKLETTFDTLLTNSATLLEQTDEYYFTEWLPSDLLLKADKMAMAHGLEVRVPFLDPQLIRYFRSVPSHQRKNRALFRTTVAPVLPEAIMKRPKQGFTLPLSRWFTDEKIVKRITPFIQKLARRTILEGDEVLEILAHPARFKNDHKLWVLLVFELWCELYVDGVPVHSITL